MVVALGVAWILDGLEITVASAVADVLTDPETLGLSSAAVGLVATVYLAGEVVGALFFGTAVRQARPQQPLHDHPGRLPGRQRRSPRLTLGNGPVWIVFLYLTRFIAGMGIGGEYAAINSAIDELIPARYRGRVDIAVNGTYWAGAILGTLGSSIFLNVDRPQPRLAARLPHRPGARPGHPVRPPPPAGEPALAGHARPRGGGRGVDRLHRARGARQSGVELPTVDESKAIELQPTDEDRLRGADQGAVPRRTRRGRSSAPR